jgi:hypothetical protein
MLSTVLAAVRPGNTTNVTIANVPKPTKIGLAVFCEKTFLRRSFIFVGLVSLLKYGWVQSSN